MTNPIHPSAHDLGYPGDYALNPASSERLLVLDEAQLFDGVVCKSTPAGSLTGAEGLVDVAGGMAWLLPETSSQKLHDYFAKEPHDITCSLYDLSGPIILGKVVAGSSDMKIYNQIADDHEKNCSGRIKALEGFRDIVLAVGNGQTKGLATAYKELLVTPASHKSLLFV